MKLSKILILFLIFSFICIRNMSASESANQVWTKTPAFKIIMKSTADWTRIMFDDNRIRFFSIEGYKWTIGNDEDDTRGCVLPGESADINWVARSTDAYIRLYAKMVPHLLAAEAGGEDCWLEVIDVDQAA